jgi:hypothetical protein
MVNKLRQRIKRNGNLVLRKRGKQRKITKKMVDFLKLWFTNDSNVGKSFKYAHKALVEESGLLGVGKNKV